MDVWELNPEGLRSYWLTSNAIFFVWGSLRLKAAIIGGVGDNVAAFLAPAIIIPWHLPYN